MLVLYINNVRVNDYKHFSETDLGKAKEASRGVQKLCGWVLKGEKCCVSRLE